MHIFPRMMIRWFGTKEILFRLHEVRLTFMIRLGRAAIVSGITGLLNQLQGG